MVQQLDRSSNIFELGSHVTKIAMIAVSKFYRPFIPEFCIMEGEIVIEDLFLGSSIYVASLGSRLAKVLHFIGGFRKGWSFGNPLKEKGDSCFVLS